MNLLNISGSPHVHSDESTKKIMWRVNLAMAPMLLCGIAYFGLNALLISLVSVACCCLFQWLIEKSICRCHRSASRIQRACHGRHDMAGGHWCLGSHRCWQNDLRRPGQESLQSRISRPCVHAHILPRADDHLAHRGKMVPHVVGHHHRSHPSGHLQGERPERHARPYGCLPWPCWRLFW